MWLSVREDFCTSVHHSRPVGGIVEGVDVDPAPQGNVPRVAPPSAGHPHDVLLGDRVDVRGSAVELMAIDDRLSAVVDNLSHMGGTFVAMPLLAVRLGVSGDLRSRFCSTDRVARMRAVASWASLLGLITGR